MILAVTDRRLLKFADGMVTELSRLDPGERNIQLLMAGARLHDRGVGRDALFVGYGIAAISDRGALRPLPTRVEDLHPGMALAGLPDGSGTLVGTRQAALRVGADDRIGQLFEPGHPATSPVTALAPVSWWNATLVRTGVGWRILERDGVLRRLGGTAFQLIDPQSSGSAIVLDGPRRVIIHNGNPSMLHEIVQIAPGEPACDSRRLEVELPQIR